MSVSSEGVQSPAEERGTGARPIREALLDAALEVFARDGFLDARIGDMAATAGVAHGTFYTYFASKEAIFRELVLRLIDQVRHVEYSPSGADTPAERIELTNRAYIRAYRDNAVLMATFDQVSTFNADILRLRNEIRRPFVELISTSIRLWQAAGLADRHLDPECSAAALGAMVERFVYNWIALGEGDIEEELAVQTLTRLWVGALDLPRSWSP